MWIIYALLAALAGALLAALSKVGLRSVDSSVALAVESVLILAIAWGAVTVEGKFDQFGRMETRVWVYLAVAGVVSGTSYLLLFRALKLANVSRVAPLDRLSLVFAIAIGAVFLKERVSAQILLGGALMAAGALLIAVAQE